MRSEKFQNEVDLKYKLYNSIFLTLPLDGIHGTGILIPILKDSCSKGLDTGKSPVEIFENFFEKQTSFRTEKEQFDFMFRVIHYIERQVVLLDAVEDAVFDKMNDLDGAGSLKALKAEIKELGKGEGFKRDLEKFAVRVVLTAHPTQFYPSTVLAIINDLIKSIQKSDLLQIKLLLTQLGKTPFFKKERPTPYDEAKSLSWYLENIFYQSASDLYSELLNNEELSDEMVCPTISFGFWPGGDRDGNPYVNTETTLKVAERLRYILFSNYYKDLRLLRRRFSFKGVYELIVDLEEKVLKALNKSESGTGISVEEINISLKKIEKILIEEHDGFFLDLLKKFQNKVKLFGAHFASIDIRQDSRIIKTAFDVLCESSPVINKQIGDLSMENLFELNGSVTSIQTDDEVSKDTITVFSAIKEIQERNGESACNRFIISNCQTSVDVARVFAMAKLCAWEETLPLDIVPLFETIDDLAKADETMRELFENKVYYQHLLSRGKKQTVMVGFSDGTKDGGYFSANWSIYKAKENITRLAREKGIVVVFFDGRGGPPARGGGNTHKFYSSLGNNIENQEIQVTIQGQTISSKFGTKASAKYYQELLITAGLGNRLFEDRSKQLCLKDKEIMETLSQYSLEEYHRFKSSDKFVPYLEKMSALKYYGKAKIGSRPSKRKASAELNFEDLRAIPFVGAWSQMKQNVPGFFGVGASIKRLKDEGRMEGCKSLYNNSLFFRTLVENSMQSISKSYFSLTEYMKKDEEFGEFWNWIYREYQLSIDMLLEVSGQKEIMELSLELKDSIHLREEIVLPLICIQQFALMKIREMDLSGNIDQNKYITLQNLVIRSLYGNINASRNSA
ncbi:phosphoenolpyruvate carboxylase [Labilibaculum antarcticum]|uniref:Phosphoenolpyruvate carboxylase n=1 Tax=Labilibaculum antarcticum TaxID=1717717 RepID=A0A1Y1CNU3_9BACT|nr:phosphoenolpyruvate carboxylase [Labilibaculum antarcticum]BAX81960.1 phosphoenolpyruvate carboxylase [Labilibaculum antarcticum]